MLRKMLRREVRREIRATGYTDLILAGLDNKISGSDADVLVTGAVEACAGLWGRTLAAARVEGSDALTARLRHRLGRDLIRQGESVYLIEVNGAGVSLKPVSEWDVLEGWRYRIDTTMPPGKITQRTVARGKVAHFMWAANPREPWRGVAPLAAASKLGDLIARVENKLSEDLNTPSATILPVPKDGGDTTLTSLRADIAGAEGRAVLAESTVGGWSDGSQAATRHDWRGERLGPEIPDSMLGAFEAIQAAVAVACGIPPDLLAKDVDGTAQRESYRRWVQVSVQPVADMVAEVASEALEAEVSFNFREIWGHDLQGRASAFQRLVAGGMDLERAVALSGLIVGHE